MKSGMFPLLIKIKLYFILIKIITSLKVITNYFKGEKKLYILYEKLAFNLEEEI